MQELKSGIEAGNTRNLYRLGKSSVEVTFEGK